MTDHKNEALAWVNGMDESLEQEGTTDGTVVAQPVVGLVHATLYLAEQQRIANLIAYWQLHTPRSIEEAFTEPGQIEVKQIHDDDNIGIDDQVRKALGLR